MLLMRSLMSVVGNDRSTRASPSILTFALEIADAAAEQHHLTNRQLHRRFRGRGRDVLHRDGGFGRIGRRFGRTEEVSREAGDDREARPGGD